MLTEDAKVPVMYLLHDNSPQAHEISVACWVCNKSFRLDQVTIDTSGPNYRAHYCDDCRPGPWPVLCNDPDCKRDHGMGTVLHGTLRTMDLIGACLEVATAGFHLDHSPQSRMLLRAFKIMLELLDDVYNYIDDEDAIDKVNEWTGEILEDLLSKIDLYMPTGIIFGMHKGDGSDLGFWYEPEGKV